MRFLAPLVGIPFLGSLLGTAKERQHILANAGRSKPSGLNCSAMPVDLEGAKELVTIFVSSSPRLEDEDGTSLAILQRALRTAWDSLRLHGARTLVLFDGRAPNVDEESWQRYQDKISRLKAWASKRQLNNLEVVESPLWRHKANTLRWALERPGALGLRTPFLFLLEDDGWLVGTVETPRVLKHLGCDPRVDYVKLLWDRDCFVGGSTSWYTRPCDRHPETELLQSTHSYSDRPHFATRGFYLQTVFPQIPPDYRGFAEDLLMYKFGRRGNMWLYGRRGEMLHEKHSGKHAVNGHDVSLTSVLNMLSILASSIHPF